MYKIHKMKIFGYTKWNMKTIMSEYRHMELIILSHNIDKCSVCVLTSVLLRLWLTKMIPGKNLRSFGLAKVQNADSCTLGIHK